MLSPTLAREPWYAEQDKQEKRLAPDGCLYTKEDFLAYYGNEEEWRLAGVMDDPGALQALLSMGFDESAASAALRRCGMDVDLAVASLLENQTRDAAQEDTTGFQLGRSYPKAMLPPATHQDSEAVAEHAKQEQQKREASRAPLRLKLTGLAERPKAAFVEASGDSS